jgi:NADH:ubiquinone oxidoreductase subunit D
VEHFVGAGAVRERRNGFAEMCYALGLVGPAARACGVERDVRQDFPFGIFRFIQVPVSTFHTGDVFARAFVRWLEIQRSVAFICDQLKALPVGPIRGELKPAAARAIARVAGGRLARRDLSRRHDGREGSVLALQGG